MGAAARAAIPPAERATLLALYQATGGANWQIKDSWASGAGSECNWYGVICDVGNAHVQQILLPGNNLVGQLPDLSSLTGLESLDMGGNALSGPIPALAALGNLQTFVAENNALTGSIPTLPANIQDVYLSGNQLTGSLPVLTGHADLTYFEAGGNRLSGSVPSLAGLSHLTIFNVSDNQLGGTLPSLADLVDLAYFHIEGNQLHGDLPNVPSRDYLVPGASTLCPNYFNQNANAAWDDATGQTPWYQDCPLLPDPIFGDHFGG